VRNENSIISESAKSAQPRRCCPLVSRLEYMPDWMGKVDGLTDIRPTLYPFRYGDAASNNNFVICSSYLIVSVFVFLLVSYAVY